MIIKILEILLDRYFVNCEMTHGKKSVYQSIMKIICSYSHSIVLDNDNVVDNVADSATILLVCVLLLSYSLVKSRGG